MSDELYIKLVATVPEIAELLQGTGYPGNTGAFFDTLISRALCHHLIALKLMPGSCYGQGQ